MHPSSGAISTPLTPCTTPSSTRTTPRRRQWYPTTACWSGGAHNAYLLRHFILKMIFLPRQARDRHRESTQKEMRFSRRKLHKSLLEECEGDLPMTLRRLEERADLVELVPGTYASVRKTPPLFWGRFYIFYSTSTI